MKNKISAAVSLFFFLTLWAAVSSWALEPQQAQGPKYNELTKEEHDVILLKGTEPPFSGKYTRSKAVGTYICRRCNSPLFDSTHKFVNSCGWPCFDDAMKDAVARSVNGAKTEIQCANCGGHLGYQCLGEGFTPKNVRNCVNSVSLTFIAKGNELPGVISSEQNGIPKKPDANKPEANENGEKASDQPHEAENQDSTPKASFEYLRNMLLEQLNNRDQDIVQSALFRLDFEYVKPQRVESMQCDEYVAAIHVIGIKLSVKKQLVDLLDNADNYTQELAIRRLGELGPKAEDALPKLREILANSVSRLSAAAAIWQISGNAEESATALVKLIREDEGSGPSAASCFEWMGPAAFSAFEAIEGLSKDPRDKVRETATKILGSFGPKHKLATEVPLKARLTDTSPEIRIAASLALLKIDGELEEAIETLLGIVDQVIEKNSATFRESPQEKLVISAINALGQFEGEAVDTVMHISLHLNSRNLNIRQAVAIALGKIGPGAEKAIPYLAKAMRDTESEAVPLVHFVVNPGDDAAKALGSIGMAAVPVLLQSLIDPEVVLRIRAARELGRIPEAACQTVGPLTARLSDPSAEVRHETIKSLGRLGKKANAAAPALTSLLFATEEVTDFGITERMCVEALRSLRRVEAAEAQMVPAILDAMERNQNLTLEAIAVLRQFPKRSSEFENPLRRLLDRNNLGAACALAALDFDDPEIQGILATNLFMEEHVNSVAANLNPVAALGIGQLVAHGAKLGEAVSAQLAVATKKEFVELSILTILLRLNPDDEVAVASMMDAMRSGNPYYSSYFDIEEAEEALVELIHHRRVRDAVLQDLDNSIDLVRSSFLSPRILIAANQHQERAFACLERKLSEITSLSDFHGIVLNFLGKQPLSELSKSLLVKMLNSQGRGEFNSDFYGNGGEMRIVREGAALALVRHNDVVSLLGQLDNKNSLVRLCVVNAIGDCGEEAITPELLEMLNDSDRRVRLAVIKTLGRIVMEHPKKKNELHPFLEIAIKDRRRSVSDEAQRTLNRW